MRYLYIASGGSNSSKDKHYLEIPNIVKAQLYYRLDIPFRKWLRSIDPEDFDEKMKDEKIKDWQSTARKISDRYALELVSQTDDTAIVGRNVDKQVYSSPRALNIFRSRTKKIYA